MGPWGVYLAGAAVAVAALSVLADRLRTPGAPAVNHPLLIAVLGALVWPVLIVGAAQVGLWVLTHQAHRAGAAAATPARIRRPESTDSTEQAPQEHLRNA